MNAVSCVALRYANDIRTAQAQPEQTLAYRTARGIARDGVVCDRFAALSRTRHHEIARSIAIVVDTSLKIDRAEIPLGSTAEKFDCLTAGL
jgi:hypothetical protein